MAKNFNLKKFGLSICITSLIVLANLFLMENVCTWSPNKNVFPELEVRGTGPRQLAESSIDVENSHSTKLYENETLNQIEEEKGTSSNNSELPFGCKESEIYRNLTVDELNKLITSCLFFVSNRKAFVVFHHYTNYLRSCFHNMIEDLLYHFKKSAKQHGVSEEYQNECWNQCKDELMINLNEIEYISRNKFYLFLQRKIIFDSEFFAFLEKYQNTWYAIIDGYEKKWTTFLKDKIKSYKPQ
ncbi:RAD protein [Plasmodium cynomolgi strain B]|uniref:RAD protein n=1 Tax=Plasmodium cynomolgi (strain B) TaxID=1120755 RepID=K6UQQ7_PLACD|nr:RAD protein [Plasmodium cynomolgi strain B]GAB65279.1 RAD protein [Plasmodium cynomolgi strain B]